MTSELVQYLETTLVEDPSEISTKIRSLVQKSRQDGQTDEQILFSGDVSPLLAAVRKRGHTNLLRALMGIVRVPVEAVFEQPGILEESLQHETFHILSHYFFLPDREHPRAATFWEMVLPHPDIVHIFHAIMTVTSPYIWRVARQIRIHAGDRFLDIMTGILLFEDFSTTFVTNTTFITHIVPKVAKYLPAETLYAIMKKDMTRFIRLLVREDSSAETFWYFIKEKCPEAAKDILFHYHEEMRTSPLQQAIVRNKRISFIKDMLEFSTPLELPYDRSTLLVNRLRHDDNVLRTCINQKNDDVFRFLMDNIATYGILLSFPLQTLLIEIVSHGTVNMLRHVVRMPEIHLQKNTISDTHSALEIACMGYHGYEFLKILIDTLGVDITYPTRDVHRVTALMRACQYHPEVHPKLLVMAEAESEVGANALFYLLRGRLRENIRHVVQLLIDNGARVTAVKFGDISLFQEFVAKYRSLTSPGGLDDHQRGIYIRAYESVVDLILTRETILYTDTETRTTPLILAAKQSPSLLRIVLRLLLGLVEEIDLQHMYINQKDEDGKTALYYTVNNHKSFVCAQLLVSHGASVANTHVLPNGNIGTLRDILTDLEDAPVIPNRGQFFKDMFDLYLDHFGHETYSAEYVAQVSDLLAQGITDPQQLPRRPPKRVVHVPRTP